MRLSWLVLGAWALLALPASASTRPTAAGPLHIDALNGSVVKLGSYSGQALLGVRLRATVCLGSRKAALNAYPTDFGVTHYLVLRSPTRWLRERSVVARPNWLVPLGETWRGACGPVVIEDPIPPQHYGGVHALGNPNSCYGVRLTISAAGRRASKRILVKCGGLR